LDTKVETIARRLTSWREDGTRFFATSSFQSSSAILLHLLHTHAPGSTVCFLNTGYHFPETLIHRRALGRRFDLDIVDVFSPIARIDQQQNGQPLFAVDPDRCCYLNKVLPLEPWIAGHDIWATGVRRTQSTNRAAMSEFGETSHGCRRWHPLIAWTDDDMASYQTRWDLPLHPLDDTGTRSIGCLPCTQLTVDAAARGGRWQGLRKTECGLHLTTGAS